MKSECKIEISPINCVQVKMFRKNTKWKMLQSIESLIYENWIIFSSK